MENPRSAVYPVGDPGFSPTSIHRLNRMRKRVRGVIPVVHNPYYFY